MKVYIGPYPDVGEQETNIQIDDYDVWGMDHTLAKIIEPMLVKLALRKQGAPYVDVEDCPPQLKPSSQSEPVTSTDDTHYARWAWVLDEMIWAFHQKNYDWDKQYYSGDKYWYLNGKVHREDGPAIEYADGDKKWYLNGNKLTEDQFNKAMNPTKELTVSELESMLGCKIRVVGEGK